MPAEALAWFNEYKVRKMFSLSHNQYLDGETDTSMSWMLHIDQVVERVEQKRRKAPQPKG